MVRRVLKEYLPEKLNGLLLSGQDEIVDQVTEIRLRMGKPVLIQSGGREYGITREGHFTRRIEESILADKEDIRQTVEFISGYSLYAWEDELKCGFITLPGGHRAGICGKVVMEAGEIKTISHISAINIRITHEIKGCSDKVFKALIKNSLGHAMIISPPGCGKTTLLRDLARNLSDGKDGLFGGVTVGIVDERQEIAGSYMGVAQNDVGKRTDILDRCPKHLGMTMLLRSMSPQIIIADEIGSDEDIKAIGDIMNAGVKLICTVHGKDLEDVQNKINLGPLLQHKFFDHYIVLSAKHGPGTVEGIYGKDFKAVNTYGG